MAEEYPTTVLPDVRAFRFRRFEHFDAVRDEFESAGVAFMTPNQLEDDALPRRRALHQVSSLHEMRSEQIAQPFNRMGEHVDGGYFYSNQWLQWHSSADDIMIGHDYPIPPSWAPMFDRPHAVQTQFFEALNRVEGGR